MTDHSRDEIEALAAWHEMLAEHIRCSGRSAADALVRKHNLRAALRAYAAGLGAEPVAWPHPDRVEFLAQWLHDEVEWPEFPFPDYTWPEHPGDTGQRQTGCVKIVPKDVVEQFRDIARRLPEVAHPAAAPVEAVAAVPEWMDGPALLASAVASVAALDDWTNNNETIGEAVFDFVSPHATWWRVKSGQALKALEEIRFAAAPQPASQKGEG